MSFRSERGAAAVEFALILPILVTLVFGIVEFGRAYNATLTLTHAAREGARAYALGGDPTAATTNAAPGLSPITVTTTPCTPGQPTTVKASYPFQWDVPFFGANLTLTGTGVMRCGG